MIFPRDGQSVEELLRHADAAMYCAKGEGRDAARVFDQSMDEAARLRLKLENQIRDALLGERLLLHYQPIMRIRDGQIVGIEALLRWTTRKRG